MAKKTRVKKINNKKAKGFISFFTRKKRQTQEVPGMEAIVETVNPQDIIIKPDQLKKTLEEAEKKLERLQTDLSKHKLHRIETVSEIRGQHNDNRRSNRGKYGVKSAIRAARIATTELNKEERDLQHKLEGEIRIIQRSIRSAKRVLERSASGTKKRKKRKKRKNKK